jgi:23S rRNA (cytosine1962-C5)-methyltransferase
MNRLDIWPDFRDAWIVHDDADLLVIDKPEGVPSQSADPERPDDAVTRARAHFGGAYLGVHQRLDQDTSGLLVLARRREANAALAAQFEGRSVKKTYIACVTGWPRGRDRATLRDAIEPGEGKAMRVARPGGGHGGGHAGGRPLRGKVAITDVRVLSRSGDRAMLELALKTGRTHQARVQLAHAGAPIAGDTLYGGAAAPRLMLHASGLELAHPATARVVRFVSRPPPELEAWLSRGDVADAVYDDDAALGRALARAVERRWGLGRAGAGPRATTAFRLVHEEGDGLPGLAIDVYDRWLAVQLHGDDGPWALPARRARVLDAIHALGFDGVYLKVRPRQASVLAGEPAARLDEMAPPEPVRGVAAPRDLTILEEGAPLRVRLGDGLSTGLFLDQRNNRRRVRAEASGKSVANLFAYTCAFTVAAALGGARRTVSVDVSAGALERGRENLAGAGVAGPEHTFVADDVFAWLERTARRGERFDLLVLDPPSYSTTRRGRFVAEDDYVRLAASASALLAEGGRMLACTNHRGISRGHFRRMLFDAARAAGRPVTQVKDLADPPDHPMAPGHAGHTKSLWVSFD